MKEISFKAFGRTFNREEAEYLIYKDKLNEIVYARMTDTLEYIILSGWKGVENWTDIELQNALDELIEKNFSD